MFQFFRSLLLCLSLALAALSGSVAFAATTAGGYVTYDPSVEGMRDLRELLPIEGCNVPGGLARITDRDEADSAPYWCGPPPHCLAEGTPPVDSCRYVSFCRREPRGDPNGIPGANGCRDPEDLICVSSGQHPEGGRCLKTCWDGSRIPFSQLCPPRCWMESDEKGNSYEVCEQKDSIPEDPPVKIPEDGKKPDPTCPDGSPVPPSGKCEEAKKPCPGGAGDYLLCHFSWGNTPDGMAFIIQSDNSYRGTLQAKCVDGGWTDINATCSDSTTIPRVCPDGEKPEPDGSCIRPRRCPDGSLPVNGSCEKRCDAQVVTWVVGSNTCEGMFGGADDGGSIEVPNRVPGLSGFAGLLCDNGNVLIQWAQCNNRNNHEPVEYCPDGSVKPTTGCPPPPCKWEFQGMLTESDDTGRTSFVFMNSCTGIYHQIGYAPEGVDVNACTTGSVTGYPPPSSSLHGHFTCGGAIPPILEKDFPPRN